eukprot:9394-Eustigmatos_ZCMA.PRE.1
MQKAGEGARVRHDSVTVAVLVHPNRTIFELTRDDDVRASRRCRVENEYLPLLRVFARIENAVAEHASFQPLAHAAQ